MNDQEKNHRKGTLKAITTATAMFLTWSVILLWSWNTLAVDLFQLPEAQFKHAIALAAITTTLVMFRYIGRKVAY